MRHQSSALSKIMSLGLLAVGLSACAKPNLVLEPTHLAPQKERVLKDGQEYSRTVLRPIDTNWPNEIAHINWQGQTLTYELKGWYASAGLSPARLQLKQVIEPKTDTWIITHEPIVNRFSGKESATVFGYNYTSKQTVKLPKDIKQVSIVFKDNKGNVAVEKTCQPGSMACD